MLLLALFAGIATGIVLGLFGSGGSIIAMPALLYLLGLEAKQSIAMSLGIIAVTATIAAWHHGRQGNVEARTALIFGLFGVAGTYAGTRLGVATPAAVQLLVFALVMYAAAWRMLRPAVLRALPAMPPALQPVAAGGVVFGPEPTVAPAHLGTLALLGIGVGVLTGFVGVGGGFLIVPALVLLAGIPMKLAVGTSLAIVAANAASGFAGYFGAVAIDWPVMAAFTSVTVVGSFAGARLARRLSAERLKRAFGGFLVLVASYILLHSLMGA